MVQNQQLPCLLIFLHFLFLGEFSELDSLKTDQLSSSRNNNIGCVGTYNFG